MQRLTVFTLLLVAALTGAVQADRGSIPLRPGIRVFEPTQTALVAWNGKEEIMILVTDLRADDSTRVLEVMPFPSKPIVQEGDAEVFAKSTSLINRKLQMDYARDLRRMVAAGGKAPQAGEISFHERIGCHDIAVAEVKDKDGFVDWVKGYFRDAHAKDFEIPDELVSSVKDYLKDKYTWFVFDLIDLSQEPITNDAIQYRFQTDHLFYPLRITRSEAGLCTVKLFVLTKNLLKDFKGIDYDKVELLTDPVTIGTREVRSLSEEMDQMFHQDNELLYRIWQIRGRLSAFDKDLIARE